MFCAHFFGRYDHICALANAKRTDSLHDFGSSTTPLEEKEGVGRLLSIPFIVLYFQIIKITSSHYAENAHFKHPERLIFRTLRSGILVTAAGRGW